MVHDAGLSPLFAHGASVINVSTIFSKTPYYGRIPYVVPKAGLNALTKHMAAELGTDKRGIRVNTIYPGPVESERIHDVFAAMDRLKRVPAGTTGNEIVDWMRLKHSPTGNAFLSKEEVAEAIVFLGTNESTAFTGHDFEVTHGLQPPKDDLTEVISRPNLRVVDLEGRLTWIIAGDQVDDACELAQKHREAGSEVYLTFRDAASVEAARESWGDDPRVTIDLLDPLDAEHWRKADATLYMKQRLPRATLVLPMRKDQPTAAVLALAASEVREFLEVEIAGAVVIARQLEQIFAAAGKRLSFDPVVTFVTNPSDGGQDALAEVLRAAVRQLIRVWRHENELAGQAKPTGGAGKRHRLRLNQLVRFKNTESVNLDLACEWALSLSNGLRQVAAIDLVLSRNFQVRFRAARLWVGSATPCAGCIFAKSR